MEEIFSRDVNRNYMSEWTCKVAVNLVPVTIQVDCASRLTDIQESLHHVPKAVTMYIAARRISSTFHDHMYYGEHQV